MRGTITGAEQGGSLFANVLVVGLYRVALSFAVGRLTWSCLPGRSPGDLGLAFRVTGGTDSPGERPSNVERDSPQPPSNERETTEKERPGAVGSDYVDEDPFPVSPPSWAGTWLGEGEGEEQNHAADDKTNESEQRPGSEFRLFVRCVAPGHLAFSQVCEARASLRQAREGRSHPTCLRSHSAPQNRDEASKRWGVGCLLEPLPEQS
jgi:hypothetical protein